MLQLNANNYVVYKVVRKQMLTLDFLYFTRYFPLCPVITNFQDFQFILSKQLHMNFDSMPSSLVIAKETNYGLNYFRICNVRII